MKIRVEIELDRRNPDAAGQEIHDAIFNCVVGVEKITMWNITEPHLIHGEAQEAEE